MLALCGPRDDVVRLEQARIVVRTDFTRVDTSSARTESDAYLNERATLYTNLADLADFPRVDPPRVLADRRRDTIVNPEEAAAICVHGDVFRVIRADGDVPAVLVVAGTIDDPDETEFARAFWPKDE